MTHTSRPMFLRNRGALGSRPKRTPTACSYQHGDVHRESQTTTLPRIHTHTTAIEDETYPPLPTHPTNTTPAEEDTTPATAHPRRASHGDPGGAPDV